MYPKLPSNLNKNSEIKAHFNITKDERNIIKYAGNEKNELGFAILLKTYFYLGFAPQTKEEIPLPIIKYISEQLNINHKLFKDFKWKGRTWERYLSEIRKITGFRSIDKNDYSILSEYLFHQTSIDPSHKYLTEKLISKCRELKLELPKDKVLTRIVNSAYQSYFDSLFQYLFKRLTNKTKKNIKALFKTKRGNEYSYSWLNSPSGPANKKGIKNEIKKLNFIKTFEIDEEFVSDIPEKIYEHLLGQINSENLWQIKRHQTSKKYTFIALFLYSRELEIGDNVVKMFLEIRKRIENRTKNYLELTTIKSIKKLYNKNQILRKLTLAIVENPEGTIPEVILKKVPLNTFLSLAEEFTGQNDNDYDEEFIRLKVSKYKKSYRSLLKPILGVLTFKPTNKKWEKLEKGVNIVNKYLDTKYTYYPAHEDVPVGILKDNWPRLALDSGKVKKHEFELGILEQIDKLIRCKEFWVENTSEFCNPSKDLPNDWDKNKEYYYDKHNISICNPELINHFKELMFSHLLLLNNMLNGKFYSKSERKKAKKRDEVYIYQNNDKKRGFFHVPKITARQERSILKEIKGKVHEQYGIVSLLDALVEADRQVGFTDYFTPATPRQFLGDDEKSKRLLINLFELGTNTGLRRTHSATNPDCSYEDLRYFRRRFITPKAIRDTISALVNRILEVRNDRIWGYTTAVASDGKQFPAWDQNLMAGSNPHYTIRGVMVYWHVEKNSVCIFSQVKNCNSSEIAAMIRGLLYHSTNMEIDTNYVDSAGQSEVAFAVSHFLGIDLLPRLKRIKSEKLYLPDKNMTKNFPNLKHVLANPIKWDLIVEQYDEMVKHVVAIIEGTATPEAILRRFTSYNETHPTYRAFIEFGKALKTIFLCRYLTNSELRQEIHDDLNVVENWNSTNSFICYGRKMKIESNNPYMQELSVLGLHLLQNALILANTLMMDKVINKEGILSRLNEEDRRAITPLFTFNINPYGSQILDLYKPSFLEAA